MTVPELAFGGVEAFVEFRGDQIFDSNYASVGLWAVIDEALTNLLGVGQGQMNA